MRTVIAFVRGLRFVLIYLVASALLGLLYVFAYVCKIAGDGRFLMWLDSKLLA